MVDQGRGGLARVAAAGRIAEHEREKIFVTVDEVVLAAEW